MITLKNTSVVEEQVIWIPLYNVYGSEGARWAQITIPVYKSNWEPLEPLTLVIDRHGFKEFWENFSTDKYAMDLVFAKYGITADTSLITDFN